MNLRAMAVHLLSATYWRYRRQREGNATSAFWVKMVFGLVGAMWGMVAHALLLHMVPALRPFQDRTALGQTVFIVFLFWLAAGYGVHRFMRANPSIYLDHLAPEEHFRGTVYTVLLLASSVGGVGAIIMALDKL